MPDFTLVFMAGMPGTGKTTLALTLGQLYRWPVIDKDSIKSPLLALGASEELAGAASYTLLRELAHDVLVQQHLSVILDSPGRFSEVLDHAREMTEQAGATLKVIFCVADRALRNQRLQSRPARLSQWKADAGLTDQEEREMFAHLPTHTLRLDTSQPLEECLARMRAYLEDPQKQAVDP